MDIIGAVSVLVMPFIVKWVTDFAKNMNGIPLMAWRITVIRAIVAVLSLVGAVLTQMIGEGELDPGLVETAALAVLNAGIATWYYLKTKQV